MFLNDCLLGYCDININNNNNNNLYPLLNRSHFDPTHYNCLLQSNSNTSGLLEVVSTRDIQSNEQLICWFSPTYLNNIKSKNYKFRDFRISIY